MKKIFHLTLVFLALFSMHSEAREILSITNRFQNRVWICRLQQADLEKSPDWDTKTKDSPPLSPREAMRVAERYVKALLDFSTFGGTGVGTIASALTLQSELPGKWIYVVDVHAIPTGSSGYPPLRIIVLMDGRVPKYTESTATANHPADSGRTSSRKKFSD